MVDELPDFLPDDNQDLEMELLAIKILYAESGRVAEGQEGYWRELNAPMENV